MTIEPEPSNDVDAGTRETAASTLMVGLPHTGKTSYLGLLFVAMVNGQSGDVVLEAFGQDHAYLNRIAARLQGFVPADHTEVGEGDGMNLTVRMPSGDAMTLAVPDLSGETWQTAHVERVLDGEVADYASQVTGIMVFTHAGDFTRSTTIAEAKTAAMALGTTEDEWKSEADVVERPAASPTQVALVDLIQIVLTQRERPFRLSLLLSAFDAATGEETPDEWVLKNLPLVAQFLASNGDSVNCRIFGVSAQGGAYANGTAADGDASRGVADREVDLLDRAYVMDGTGAKVKLHEPLLWALGDG